jgi:hypothetical protein
MIRGSRFVRRLVRLPLVILAALIFLFEDVLWAWLEALLARLSRLRAVAWLETRIAQLPPYPAMALFLVPLVVLMPAHLLALYFIATGHAAFALLVYLVAKFVGTAMLAWIYRLCSPALLSLGWFARLHAWILRTKTRLYAELEALPAWQAARRVVAGMRTRLRGGALRARTDAIRRRWRRA